MVANIELKSLDFDDENFSPVFNRTKKEFFLTMSEKYKKDISRVFMLVYVLGIKTTPIVELGGVRGQVCFNQAQPYLLERIHIQ